MLNISLVPVSFLKTPPEARQFSFAPGTRKKLVRRFRPPVLVGLMLPTEKIGECGQSPFSLRGYLEVFPSWTLNSVLANATRLRKLDVGTTFTVTSFCLLQPGNVPKFEEVLLPPSSCSFQTRLGDPQRESSLSLYYDSKGNAMAFRAETEDETDQDTILEAEEKGWTKTEWWKLVMRPGYLPIIKDLALPLKEQIKAYITSTYGSGGNIWDILSPTMYIILMTPNGWEGSQQNRMRQAAIDAGLVDQAGSRRVKFVTEAEAAVLYAADSGSVGDWLVDGGQLILCDCGGGTIDIILPERLRGTEWDDKESIQRIIYHFDRNANKKFAEGDAVCYVQLSSHKTIPEIGITRGRLKITG
ncbi:hypothetical protein DFH07DRAFT_776004 [Mycena maculata]|uniref:Actin-like ATPase domain-containing protein n=1 Tax=Mycena maculata TaxID=230809 RepID=A0AAD7IS50_9AGAR|nr:hypothetical protein DFH07DRAFT_776004 [Mycena maculata]